MTRQSEREAAADLAYWQELADLVPGWRVMGWTYRQGATYITPGHWGPQHTDTLNVTGRQRDDLVRALYDEQTPMPKDECAVCGGPPEDHGLLNGYPDKHNYE